jgi:hypothetical protein
VSADIHTPFADELEKALQNMEGPMLPRMHAVIIEGRAIPKLLMLRRGDTVNFTLDGRFGLEVPKEHAIPVAHFIANAMAIGAGYPWHGADSNSRPFATPCIPIEFPTKGDPQ